MRVAVTSAVYNEEKNIAAFIDALLAQTRAPDEIILVDDGSTDGTADIIREKAAQHPQITYIHQSNQGPATARNTAWRKSTADICLFTDGDCVPEPNWIEELIRPFDDASVGASAGRYKTLNPKNVLARFIGYEIDWRYKDVKGEINAHGSYNLAVRKSILEEVGGFREDYPKPSGEDFDLTYKISQISKMIFTRKAIVGHYHPTDFWWYLNNQARRAYDRIKVYRDHPDKQKSDSYTGNLPKYQVACAGLCFGFFTLIFVTPAAEAYFHFFSIILLLLCVNAVPYYWRKDIVTALISPFIVFCRSFAWFLGAIMGMIHFKIGNKK